MGPEAHYVGLERLMVGPGVGGSGYKPIEMG